MVQGPANTGFTVFTKQLLLVMYGSMRIRVKSNRPPLQLDTTYQCLLQSRVSRVIDPVGRRLDPVENIVPGHL